MHRTVCFPMIRKSQWPPFNFLPAPEDLVSYGWKMCPFNILQRLFPGTFWISPYFFPNFWVSFSCRWHHLMLKHFQLEDQFIVSRFPKMLLLILIWFYSSPVQSQEKTSHFGELHQAFIFKNLPNHTCRDTWCGNSLQLREQRKIASFTKIRKEAKKVGITVSSLSHCVRTSRWNNTWPLQIFTPCWFYSPSPFLALKLSNKHTAVWNSKQRDK